MSNPLVASGARALRFSSPCGEREITRPRTGPLSAFSAGEWAKQLGVLDRAGLTLPLYARLLACGQIAGLPDKAIGQLERRRNDNTRRMEAMLARFGEAVQVLRRAEVQFLCVKGFSLIPEFLPELWQRHQIDFDFLIRPGEELRAQLALEGLGYRLTAVEGSERRLRIPPRKALGHHAYLYEIQEGAAIELHSSFWEPGAIELPLLCPQDAFEHAEMHQTGPVSFPRLAPHHAILYQVLHVFRHFLGSWARPLWVYEIAASMDRLVADDALWHRIRALIGNDAAAADAMALVMLTAREIYACPIPAALEDICAIAGESAIGLWVSRYASDWLLADMPGNKLNLLLHRHFVPESRVWRRYLANRVAPRRKSPRLCEGIDPAAALSFRYRIADLRYRARRMFHHLRAGAGLALAGVRWSRELRALRTSHISVAPRAGESKLWRRSES